MSTDAQARVPEWTLGDRLRKARQSAGFEQSDFAEATGIARGTIHNYEQDKTRPKRPYLLTWAMATGVPIEWLEDGQAPRPTPPGPGGGKPSPELEALTRAKRDRSRTTSGRRTTAGYLPAVA